MFSQQEIFGIRVQRKDIHTLTNNTFDEHKTKRTSDKSVRPIITVSKERPCWRRWLPCLLFALVAFVVGYATIGMYVIDVAASVSCETSDSERSFTPTSFGETVDAVWWVETYETVTIPILPDDQLLLDAFWIPHSTNKTSRGTILVLHGLTSSRRARSVLVVAGMLSKAGFNVLVPDLRNHGSSTCIDGIFTAGTKESDDLLVVVKWLEDNKLQPNELIGVYGQSLGARVAILLAAKTKRITAYALDSAPLARFQDLVQFELANQGIPQFVWYPLDTAMRILHDVRLDETTVEDAFDNSENKAFLITAGPLDNRVPYAFSIDGYRYAIKRNPSIRFKTQEHPVRGPYGHVEMVTMDSVEYEKILVPFFQRVMA